MKYLLEVDDKNMVFAETFFHNVKFIKNIKAIDSNEITNPSILKSISDYESKQAIPTVMNLADQKAIFFN
jgi:hypothetical protein